MPVDISINLKTGKAHGEIAELKTALEGLEEEGVEFGELDFDGLTESLDNVSDKMEEIRKQTRALNQDLEDALGDFDGIDINIGDDDADGTTGAPGGEADPPDGGGLPGDGDGDGGGMSFEEFQERMNRLFGFDTPLGESAGRFEKLKLHELFEDPEALKELMDAPGPRTGSLHDPVTGDFTNFEQLSKKLRVKDTPFGPEESLFQFLNRKGELTDAEMADVLKDPRARFGDPMDADMGTPGGRNFFQRIAKQSREMDNANARLNRFGKILKRFKPTMRKWWSLLALIIPLLITFGVHALGVAAAMGGLAAAGAAVIGLGLGGHAQEMGDAFSEAQAQIQDFKEDLFEVFQPAMQTFAPIQSEFFDFAPAELEQVSESLEGLVVFEDAIFRMFSGLASFTSDAIDGLVANADAVEQLAMRFGAILGTNILEFFGFLLREAQQNQGMLIELGQVLEQLARIVYNLSRAFSVYIIAVRPVLNILELFSELLNNRLLLALFSFIVTTYAAATAFASLGKSVIIALNALGVLGSGGLTKAIVSGLAVIHSQIVSLITAYTSLAGAAAAAAAAMAMTGVGLLAVGAGALAAGNMLSKDFTGQGDFGGQAAGAGSVGAGRGNATVVNNYNSYEITHNGDMTRDSEQRLISSIDNPTATPSPDTETSESSARPDRGGS